MLVVSCPTGTASSRVGDSERCACSGRSADRWVRVEAALRTRRQRLARRGEHGPGRRDLHRHLAREHRHPVDFLAEADRAAAVGQHHLPIDHEVVAGIADPVEGAVVVDEGASQLVGIPVVRAAQRRTRGPADERDRAADAVGRHPSRAAGHTAELRQQRAGACDRCRGG